MCTPLITLCPWNSTNSRLLSGVAVEDPSILVPWRCPSRISLSLIDSSLRLSLPEPSVTKCVKTVTFVVHSGQQITVTRHENGTFMCYCSQVSQDSRFCYHWCFAKKHEEFADQLARSREKGSHFNLRHTFFIVTVLCKQSGHQSTSTDSTTHVSALEITITTTNNAIQVSKHVLVQDHTAHPSHSF